MDEPTNHLDLESSESLARSLTDYDGTLVFVSHNRSLIRAVATKIWNVEDGQVETYPGTLLLLDSSKFGVRSLSRVVPLSEVDILVTDKDAPSDLVGALRAQGIDVHIV